MVRRLVDACLRLEVVKRSVCIEGARRAFARVKVQWAKLDAVKLIKEGPPEGKEHRHPKMFYEGVLKGARLIADECTKDIIFEKTCSCNLVFMKTCSYVLCNSCLNLNITFCLAVYQI